MPGTNADADLARAMLPAIDHFLCQDMAERTPAPAAWAALDALLGSTAALVGGAA